MTPPPAFNDNFDPHQRIFEIARESAMFEVLILDQLAEVARLFGGKAALHILATIETPFECAPHLSDALHVYLAVMCGRRKGKKAQPQSPECEAKKERILRNAKSLARIQARYREAVIQAEVAKWPASPTERIQ